ncbi:MAG TPA: hypothetical protein DEB40_10260 [Elusimicrobia bacterium]|nr:hypothetical protein [Elusimicrobiota bacterium]HBT62112.1 hypothetical protein [Elusimicrobiota bacterium]
MADKTSPKPEKILVVDDQLSMRLTLRGILVKKGYDVTVAEDGARALEQIQKDNYRVIFMDIRMPGMNGVQTFLEMKKTRPNATVIMMTAHALEDEIKTALREGAYTVLHKPFEMDRMLALLKECLEDRPLVLVVDGNREICDALKEALEGYNYRVLFAENGEQCLDQLQQRRFQVIILDLKLPDNGLATLRDIKEMRPEAGVIVLATSATEQEALEQAMQFGTIAYLRKPFDPHMIIEILQKYLPEAPQKDG